MMSAVPIEIHHMKEKSLVRIQWDDGHRSDYPRAHLRGYCPCALCQGHGGHIQFIEGVPSGLGEITPVGNYAIQFAVPVRIANAQKQLARERRHNHGDQRRSLRGVANLLRP
jgi:hypothetical protein